MVQKLFYGIWEILLHSSHSDIELLVVKLWFGTWWASVCVTLTCWLYQQSWLGYTQKKKRLKKQHFCNAALDSSCCRKELKPRAVFPVLTQHICSWSKHPYMFLQAYCTVERLLTVIYFIYCLFNKKPISKDLAEVFTEYGGNLHSNNVIKLLLYHAYVHMAWTRSCGGGGRMVFIINKNHLSKYWFAF